MGEKLGKEGGDPAWKVKKGSTARGTTVARIKLEENGRDFMPRIIGLHIELGLGVLKPVIATRRLTLQVHLKPVCEGRRGEISKLHRPEEANDRHLAMIARKSSRKKNWLNSCSADRKEAAGINCRC